MRGLLLLLPPPFALVLGLVKPLFLPMLLHLLLPPVLSLCTCLLRWPRLRCLPLVAAVRRRKLLNMSAVVLLLRKDFLAQFLLLHEGLPLLLPDHIPLGYCS